RRLDRRGGRRRAALPNEPCVLRAPADVSRACRHACERPIVRRVTMHCHRAERIMIDRREGALSATESRSFSHHLERCAACRRLRDDISHVRLAATAPAADATSGIAERAIAASRRESASAFRWPRTVLAPALASAVLL